MPTVSVQLREQPLRSRPQTPVKVAKHKYQAKRDRPGWIPSHVKSDWDTDPYAYQTEEEMMPQGGPHGLLSTYICEILRSSLKERDLILLQDPFLLYWDQQKIKQRIAPDLLLMPFCFPAPHSYDMDVEPPPLCVVEITSPKSHKKDLDDNKTLYMNLLGIETYLIIDAITPQGKLHTQMELEVWRLVNGKSVAMTPDNEGCLVLPEMGLKVKALGQKLFFIDRVTGNRLLNTTELKKALQSEVQRAAEEIQQVKEEAQREAQRADMEAQRAEIEAQRANMEAQRAKIEAQRANVAEQKVMIEAQRAHAAEQRSANEAKARLDEAKARHAAEAEVARLKALLG